MIAKIKLPPEFEFSYPDIFLPTANDNRPDAGMLFYRSREFGTRSVGNQIYAVAPCGIDK